MAKRKYLWPGLSGLLLAVLIISIRSERPVEQNFASAPPLEPARETIVAPPDAALTAPIPTRINHDRAPIGPLSLADRLAQLRQMAQDETDPAAFESFLVEWLAGIDPSEISAALAFVPKAGLDERMTLEVATRLVRQWTEHDVAAAWQWADGLPTGPLRDGALESIAIIRSEQDLAAATVWASQLPEGADRDRIAAAVANEALRTEPARALQLADNLPSTPANDDLIRRAAMEWTAQDQPRALQWAEQLPDEAFRAQVLSGMAIAWSNRDPIAAGRLVLAEVPAGREQEDTLVSIAQRWAQQSPAATARWVDSFPRGDLKRAAVESVAAIWGQNNPAAAEGWKATAAAADHP